jgi:hypothetical protein
MKEEIIHLVGHLPDALTTLLIVLGSFAGGLLLKTLLFGGLRAYQQRSKSALASSVHEHLRPPMGYFIPLLLLSMLVPLIPLNGRPFDVFYRVVETAFIGSFAWALICTVDVIQDSVLRRYQLSQENNLAVRKLFTQLQFVKKVVVSLIVLGCHWHGAHEFCHRAAHRHRPTDLAGIASVIIGFAAQRSIGNLLAGFQIAFTQPLRIDDVLVVEGEWAG